MKNYKNKIKIFYVLICAGVLLVSINIHAVDIGLEISDRTDKEALNTIIVPDDYPTISEALTHAIDGDTIFVKPGVYKENLVIDKMISLEGAAWEHVIIDGDKKDHVIKIATSGVTVSGFTITNSCDSCAGIDINMNHYNTITKNLIQLNYIGIKLYSSTGNSINNNIIKENIYTGLTCEASHFNNITDNELNNNGLSGMYFHFTSTFNDAKYNVIDENGLDQDASFYKSSIAGGIVFDTACRSNSIVSNDIKSNEIGVNSEGNNENNIVYYNSFVDNAQVNARDTDKNDWSKEGIGNYWSDYTGIDEDGDGIGDTPYAILGGDNEDEYPLVDSPNPQPPEINGPEKWNTNDGEVEFTFTSKDSNYPEVWFEITWGDDSEPEIIGPVNSLNPITVKHGYEIDNLQYTVRAKTAVLLMHGETLKSIWARHKITISKIKNHLQEKNGFPFFTNYKLMMFPKILVRLLGFFDKTSTSQISVNTKNLQFSRLPIEFTKDKSYDPYDRPLEEQLLLKFFFLFFKK